MRSIFGEWTGNVRSTPTPNDCLRTVNVSRTPLPWRLITTPSKTWVRRRVPSTTWKWTFTRSPAWKLGTRRSCARSRLSITPVMAERERDGRGFAAVARRPRMVAKESVLSGAPLAAPRPPPGGDLGVVAGQEDVGPPPAAPLERPGVVRILRRPLERLAERLLDGALGV